VGGGVGELLGDPHQGGGVVADDAADRPHLRIGQLTGRERGGDHRQLAQRPGDAEVFVGGADVHADLPRHPVRTGCDPVTRRPQLPRVELGQVLQKPALGGGDVTGDPE
jgi:hypothetical protein